MYKYPFPENIEAKPVQPTGIYTHGNYPESKYAIDFLLPEGTSILAAREGKVMKTKDDSNEYGLNPIYATKANYVAIEHNDGTYAEYVHLKHKGVTVQQGQVVQAGEIIGYSGLSGCMDVSHLHFNVFKIEDGKGISIPFEFLKK
jgi:murein DD-endopeptidase MepM/ murein hydrolase activator NlpD